MTSSPRYRLSASLVASIALLAFVAACKPGGDGSVGSRSGAQGAAAPGLAVTVEVDGAASGPASVTVGVRDGGDPVTGARVEVRGDMTHAGMAPVLADAAEVEPGVYEAEGFAFTMAGDWIVSATVTTVDGREATAETFVNVAR